MRASRSSRELCESAHVAGSSSMEFSVLLATADFFKKKSDFNSVRLSSVMKISLVGSVMLKKFGSVRLLLIRFGR